MKAPSDAQIYAGLALGAVLLGYWLYKRAGAVAQAVNPLNDRNVFISGANATTRSLTGDESFGGWLYDLTHSDPLKG